MASARRPRLDQIAELTRRIRLPLPAIEDAHLQVLAEGLQEAFDDLCERRPSTMATGNEPEVTTLLQARLNGLCEEDSLWGRLFGPWHVGRRASASMALIWKSALIS